MRKLEALKKPTEIKIGDYTLEEILERHVHWLNKDCKGWENMRANLCNADLHNTNLCNANLYNADLCNADLRNAKLHGADLRNADLSFADLSGANLWDANMCGVDMKCADLSGANLYKANLCFAELSDADLSGANLHSANLCDAILHGVNLCAADLRNANLCEADLCAADMHNANLCDAENIPFISLACPSEGSFIGWKKVNNYLVKLNIPASAKRCSATTEKCRASAAKVLGIYTLDGEKTDLKNVVNANQMIIPDSKIPELDYIVGKTVYPDSFDDNRWHECSHGIHFFINKEDAIHY